LVTNAIYVGYSNNLKKRFKDYKSNRVKTQPLIYKSILKHGFHNHRFDILFSFTEEPTTNQLKQVESIFIRYYRYWKGNVMLNTNDGGGGSRKLSKDEKEKKGRLRRGFHKRGILQYGLDGIFVNKWNSILEVSKKLSLDYNLLIKCLKNKGYTKSVGGFQWIYDTFESESKLGQYDSEGNLIKVWSNGAEFLRASGKSIKCTSAINDAVTGKRYAKTAYGFTWKLIHPENITGEYPNIEPYEKNLAGKSILQYDLNGNFIREWKSIVDASNELNIIKTEIYNSANGRINKKYSRQTPSFQWRYKSSDDIPNQIDEFGYPVIAQYTLHGEFVRTWDSIVEATKFFGSGRSSIASCIGGTVKKSKGFQWRRFMSNEVPLKIKSVIRETSIIDNKKTNIKLLQYGMNGKFIKAWEYPKEVEKAIGIDSSLIYGNLKGKLKSAGKFRWKYGDVNEIGDLTPLRVICQYDLSNNLIKIWNSAKEIVANTRYGQSSISNNISGRTSHAYGFIWAYQK
jgi:hypothetical protein